MFEFSVVIGVVSIVLLFILMFVGVNFVDLVVELVVVVIEFVDEDYLFYECDG